VIREALILNAFHSDDDYDDYDDDDVVINRARRTIQESMNISAKDSLCYFEL
jgi:hypothetical protein